VSELDDAYFEVKLPPDREFQVIGFGENAVDLVCRVPHFPLHDSKVQMEKIIRLVGGTIATACTLCARYGLVTRYMGRVGGDETGEFALEDLKKEDMDLQVETVPGASSHLSLIIVDRPTGGRTIIWDRDPNLNYKTGELARDRLTSGQILHLDGNDIDACIQAAQWGQEAGMTVVLDIDKVQPGVDSLLSKVDFAIPSQDFTRNYTGCPDWQDGIRRLGKYCRGVAAVTLGQEGAAILWRNEVYHFPAFPVTVVDSTGSGDIFHGAFIYSMLQGWSVGKCMRFSNAAGGLACTRLGARSGIPLVDEVHQMESSRSVPETIMGGRGVW
jgi:sugar/nucleoside kinase (ribokinase family)